MKLSAAGNVQVPAFLVLVSKGYKIERTVEGDSEWWTATKEQNTFGAASPTELLGVVIVGEVRGEAWLATDDEIDAFLGRFTPVV